MSKTIAYLRASTDKQDLKNQKLEIFEYARKNQLEVNDFIQITISSRRTSKDRRIDEMVLALDGADTLIVTELSRLGRSTAEVIGLVNELIKKEVRVIAIKQNLDIRQQNMNSKIIITLFSLFAELERDLISSRTKEALGVFLHIRGKSAMRYNKQRKSAISVLYEHYFFSKAAELGCKL
jgi:DNA invertase Pin-like site-specific DNA recombinase